ncbi:hypothetical protein GCM10022247_20150 [Allokutzneria multivorans]|uniref:Uncharacterized protein n=1 Tax=Allokutzneria multivorans TaxID=1142134 RepID=A0ABP7RNV2_9PSEU
MSASVGMMTNANTTTCPTRLRGSSNIGLGPRAGSAPERVEGSDVSVMRWLPHHFGTGESGAHFLEQFLRLRNRNLRKRKLSVSRPSPPE